eukprot:7275962-Pyramimonas_sp.AAC.1
MACCCMLSTLRRSLTSAIVMLACEQTTESFGGRNIHHQQQCEAGARRMSSRLAWLLRHVAAEPPARHCPFFQYLEPLKGRFIEWLAHVAEREATQAPTIAEWWPLLWATDIAQHARPMSCLALAA